MESIHSRNQQSPERTTLLIIALIFSLFLHIISVAVILYLADTNDMPTSEPTFVSLIDKLPADNEPTKPEAHKEKEIEIDQSPSPEPDQEPVKSHRKAVEDQKVIKEQAPEGDDVRDQTTARPQPLAVPKKSRPAQPSRKTVSPKKSEPIKKETRPQSETVRQPPSPATQHQESVEESSPAPQLAPQQLLPDQQTLDRIVRAEQGARNRVKQRDDVEIGDTVWLNLQHDLLVSFFRRFHDKIERVWNYPAEALQSELEGTLELFITVNKDGELIDVDLRRSSGSDLLDFEAIQAIYRAAPFGPLSKHYPHETLNIRAHFRYSIVGKYIYGQ